MIDTHIYKYNKDKRQDKERTKTTSTSTTTITTQTATQAWYELNIDMADVIHERATNVSVSTNTTISWTLSHRKSSFQISDHNCEVENKIFIICLGVFWQFKGVCRLFIWLFFPYLPHLKSDSDGVQSKVDLLSSYNLTKAT